MDYEIRGTANEGELKWLYEHPVGWIRALQVAKKETRMRIFRDNAALSSDPRKPGPNATHETHTEWLKLKAEVERVRISRLTFINKVNDRIAMVRETLPREEVPLQRIDTLIMKLLDIETKLSEGDTEGARRSLGNFILSLARRKGLT